MTCPVIIRFVLDQIDVGRRELGGGGGTQGRPQAPQGRERGREGSPIKRGRTSSENALAGGEGRGGVGVVNMGARQFGRPHAPYGRD